MKAIAATLMFCMVGSSVGLAAVRTGEQFGAPTPGPTNPHPQYAQSQPVPGDGILPMEPAPKSMRD